MNWKIFLLRFALLIVSVLGGAVLLALVMNGLIMFHIVPPEIEGVPGGRAILMKTSFVFMGAIIAGLVSIFINPSWRYILLLSPVYAPSIFAIIFAIMHHDPAAAVDAASLAAPSLPPAQ